MKTSPDGDIPHPCPYRILDGIGHSFCCGIVGGSAFYSLKGMHNSPKGECLISGLQAARMKAPRLAGRFALYYGVCSTFEYSLAYLRKKNDPWNFILAGTVTPAIVYMRQGFASVALTGLATGVAFALVEGAMIYFNKVESDVHVEE